MNKCHLKWSYRQEPSDNVDDNLTTLKNVIEKGSISLIQIKRSFYEEIIIAT